MNPWFKALVCMLYLSVMIVFAHHQTNAPEARQDSDIDYAQLAQHVEVMAARPHPIGSQANQQVRDYITGYLESLGLTTEIQKTTVVYRHPSQSRSSPIIGSVENIIARLPGSGGPARGDRQDLVLMAHYDSRENALGAGDDLSGTASILETARVMSGESAPAHDVIFLITDGEEMGLLGAQGFFRQHPMAEDVGLVLNFEARGSRGGSGLFETSENNAWLVDHIIKAIPDLSGDSVSYEVYKRMPNDTDLSISKGEGIAGLNFAFTKGYFDYHAMTDSSANLDSDTLAQQANNALFATRYFANLKDWQSAEGDKTFFDTGVAGMVSYSQSTAMILGVAVLLLGGVVLVLALRAGQTSFKSLGNGLMALLVVLVFSYGIFQIAVGFQPDSDRGFYPSSGSLSWLVALGEWPLLAYFCVTVGGLLWLDHVIKRGMKHIEVVIPPLLVALIGLASGTWQVPAILVLLVMPLMSVLRGRRSRVDMWAASLLLWWLLALLILFSAPNASYLLIWPLLSILLGVVLQQRIGFTVNSRGRFATVLLASWLPLLLLAPLVIMLYVNIGQTAPQAMMGLVAVLVLMGWPLFRLLGANAQGRVGLTLMSLGVISTVFFMTVQQFDERHPRGEELFYIVDVNHQQSFWATRYFGDGGWLREFFGDNVKPFDLSQIVPGYDSEALASPAPMLDIQTAQLSIISDETEAGIRKLGMQLVSPSNASYVALLFSTDAEIQSLEVNGQRVDVPEQSHESDWWRLRWYGFPDSGGEFSFTTGSDEPVKIRIVEVDRKLPPGAPARPSDSMPELYSFSDSTYIFQTVTID